MRTIKPQSLWSWFLALVITTSICSCSRSKPEGLIGLWRTETSQRNPTGDTNTAGSYETVEFQTNGMLTITSVTIRRDGIEVPIPVGGTYSLLATNQIKVEIVPNPARPDIKYPFTISFSISDDVLEVPVLEAGATNGFKKYRRVKK